MKISRIEGTCSMCTLHDVPYIKDLTKNQVDNLIFTEKAKDEIGSVKTVLFNTNKQLDFVERIIVKRNSGFKRISSYKGNNGRVDVYLRTL